MNDNQDVFRLHNIGKRFGGLVALNNIGLSVKAKEIVGILGPNGAGKSTLFNVITSLYQPDSGDVFLNGKKITGKPPHTICRLGIARTFQLVKTFSGMTAFENVLVGATYGNSQRGVKAKQAALDALELVDLTDQKDTPVVNMTLSDRRLLEVARAMASMPDVALLDEPMAGLNPAEIVKMLQVINRAREETNTAILWVEHKVDAIFHLCDRIIVIVYGEKIADGKPEEIARDSNVIKAYLGEASA